MVLHDLQKTTGSRSDCVKVFLRYVDDLVRTFKGDPGVVLEATNKFHPNLQFTIEELDSNGNLAFLDLKVHKQGTPLRPVLSLPGSSCDNLNKPLAKYFAEIEGANIETNTQMAREIVEKTELDVKEFVH